MALTEWMNILKVRASALLQFAVLINLRHRPRRHRRHRHQQQPFVCIVRARLTPSIRQTMKNHSTHIHSRNISTRVWEGCERQPKGRRRKILPHTDSNHYYYYHHYRSIVAMYSYYFSLH